MHGPAIVKRFIDCVAVKVTITVCPRHDGSWRRVGVPPAAHNNILFASPFVMKQRRYRQLLAGLHSDSSIASAVFVVSQHQLMCSPAVTCGFLAVTLYLFGQDGFSTWRSVWTFHTRVHLLYNVL